MKDTISKLLEAYEKGNMSRRRLIQGLAILAAGTTAAEAAGIEGNEPPEHGYRGSLGQDPR